MLAFHVGVEDTYAILVGSGAQGVFRISGLDAHTLAELALHGWYLPCREFRFVPNETHPATLGHGDGCRPHRAQPAYHAICRPGARA